MLYSDEGDGDNDAVGGRCGHGDQKESDVMTTSKGGNAAPPSPPANGIDIIIHSESETKKLSKIFILSQYKQ